MSVDEISSNEAVPSDPEMLTALILPPTTVSVVDPESLELDEPKPDPLPEHWVKKVRIHTSMTMMINLF